MFEYLLPIGTVVRIKRIKKPVMIIGLLQSKENIGKRFDYTAVTYPEGFLGADLKLLFNHSDIDEILYRGYEDGENGALKEFHNLLELLGKDSEGKAGKYE